MGQNIKIYIIVAAITFVTIALFKPALNPTLGDEEYKRWRSILLFSPLPFLFIPNYWLAVLVLFALLTTITPKEVGKRAVYFILALLCLPNLMKDIPGAAGINILFEMSSIRLVILAMLLPALSAISSSSNRLRLFQHPIDKYVLGYILLTLLLYMRNMESITSFLREGWYSYLDHFLIYYVVSRAIQSKEDLRAAFYAFAVVGTIMAMITLFEFVTNWLIFHDLHHFVGSDAPKFSAYATVRAGVSRPVAAYFQPIELGLILAVCIGCFTALFYTQKFGKNKWIIIAILVGGLLGTLSKGPLLGAVAFALVFVILGKSAIKSLVMLGIFVLVTLGTLSVVPHGDKVLSVLPIVGEPNSESFDYRSLLFQQSMLVIKKNLLFGSTNFLETPEMQVLIQGQGIIDIVNTYIAVALTYGGVGLFFYVMILVSSALCAYKNMRRCEGKDDELKVYGQALVALIVAFALTIATVSSIGRIWQVLLILVALSTAYSVIVRNMLSAEQQSKQTITPPARDRFK